MIPSAMLFAAVFLTASLISPDIKWPTLPKKGFISGRSAREADVKAKRAAFVVKLDNKYAGIPIQIQIPQFAYHIDGDKKTPVIIIQAEQMGDKKCIGARYLNGSELVGLIGEFEFLGIHPPSN